MSWFDFLDQITEPELIQYLKERRLYVNEPVRMTDEEMEDIVLRESVGTCIRCGDPLFPSDISGYAYQCFKCDEDFYAFEQGRNS